MRGLILKVAPVLRLTRVTGAFAAVANVWFVILWTRAGAARMVERAPAELTDTALPVLLLGAATNAVGLYAFAASLNDLLDARRDRTLHPTRPIPSQAVSVDWAAALSIASLILALLGATTMGRSAVLMSLLVAAAVLFFHAVGKFVPAIGLVLLGLIYAGQMLTPNLSLHFLWPVWLVMTHALIVGAACHAIGRRVPPISQRALWTATAGWLFWSAVLLYLTWLRTGSLWPDWARERSLIWIGILAVALVAICYRRVRVHGPGVRAAEKVARYGALWPACYGCAWLFSQGWTNEGWIILALTLAGVLGMTVLRETYAMIEEPIDYRR